MRPKTAKHLNKNSSREKVTFAPPSDCKENQYPGITHDDEYNLVNLNFYGNRENSLKSTLVPMPDSVSGKISKCHSKENSRKTSAWS